MTTETKPQQTKQEKAAAAVAATLPSKAPLEPVGVAIGAIIGTLFLTISMLDLSIAMFGNIPLTLQWYIFKANAPILKPTVTAITLLVPIAILQSVVGVLQAFTHKASKVRNVCDVLGAAAFAAVIYLAVAYTQGYEGFILDSALAGNVDAVTAEFIQDHIKPLTVGFVLNVTMLILPIIAYVSQVNAQQAEEKKAEVVAAPAPAAVAVVEQPAAAAKSKKD